MCSGYCAVVGDIVPNKYYFPHLSTPTMIERAGTIVVYRSNSCRHDMHSLGRWWASILLCVQHQTVLDCYYMYLPNRWCFYSSSHTACKSCAAVLASVCVDAFLFPPA
jgi:hypothetical protein